jgi:hypothetical protein
MRTTVTLFVVSALLFVFGIGFVVVGARTMRSAAATPGKAATVTVVPVATTGQIMSAIVSPASNAIFEAVQTTSTREGVQEIYPKTDDAWALLGAQAASLAEAGNLIMMDGRAIDRGDWLRMSQAMIDAAKETMKAVQKRDPDGVLAAGEAVNTSCDTCHERYRRQ